jgi:Fe2+ or Zn2+ uptake regulation protein
VHWKRHVTPKKCGHIHCEPCGAVQHICHDQNTRVKREPKNDMKMSMQTLRLKQHMQKKSISVGWGLRKTH